MSASAGPLFSLVSGLLILALPLRRLTTFWRLSWLWLGLASVQSFNGYLITGPFVDAGDIGQAWTLLDAPPYVPWVGFVVGWVLTVLLGRHAAGRFGAYLSADGGRFRSELPALGVYGWLVGTAIAVVLSLGVVGAGDVGGDIAFFSALALMAAGVCTAFVGVFVSRALAAPRQVVELTTPVTGMVVLVVVALVRQLVIGPGIGL